MTQKDRAFILLAAIATTSMFAHDAVHGEIKVMSKQASDLAAPPLSDEDREFLFNICRASPAPSTSLIDAAAYVLDLEAGKTVANAAAAAKAAADAAAAKAAADAAAKAAATAPEAFGGTTPATPA